MILIIYWYLFQIKDTKIQNILTLHETFYLRIHRKQTNEKG